MLVFWSIPILSIKPNPFPLKNERLSLKIIVPIMHRYWGLYCRQSVLKVLWTNYSFITDCSLAASPASTLLPNIANTVLFSSLLQLSVSSLIKATTRSFHVVLMSLLAFCSSVISFLFLFADPVPISALTTKHRVKKNKNSQHKNLLLLANLWFTVKLCLQTKCLQWLFWTGLVCLCRSYRGISIKWGPFNSLLKLWSSWKNFLQSIVIHCNKI